MATKNNATTHDAEASLQTLREVLALPTAAYHEGHVADYIRDYAARRGWRCETDAAGNLHIRVRRGRAAATPLVFEAHLDHPGFHVDAADGSQVKMSFRGKAPGVDLVGGRVLIFSDPSPPTAAAQHGVAAVITATRALPGFYHPLEADAQLCDAQDTGDLAPKPGDFAVFDLPTWSLDGDRLSARAHDDLAQVAAVLVALDRLDRGDADVDADVDVDVTGLFTRAEEVGFVGARAAVEAGSLPEAAVVIVLECSGLPAERGFVVRAGDLTSMYDGWATTRLMQLADQRAAADPGFIYQTPIPRRGTCNASLYAAMGHKAAGLTLPMQNYHNRGPDGVAAETIDLRDWTTLTDFLITVATDFGDYTQIQQRIRDKMDRIWDAEKSNL